MTISLLTDGAAAEEWRTVPSLPGVMASSWGRVKLPDTQAHMPNGNLRQYHTKPVIGSWAIGSGGGRYIIRWRRAQKTLKVARLVCEAFHGPAPFPRAVVMHKDENSRNNRPDNLEWGTQKQNLNAPRFLDYCRARTGDNNPFLKGRAAKAQRFLSQMRG